MELKTTIHAEENCQELFVFREFQLPVHLLFKAFTTPELVEQWMGTKVLALDGHPLGRWKFETTDPHGNVHGFHGCIHEFVENKAITRTFEMANADFGPQLEFLSFEAQSQKTSKLTMHMIFRSVDIRDRMLKLPFAMGINMAHNRLQEIFS